MLKAMLGDSGRTESEWEELWRNHVRQVGKVILWQILSLKKPAARLLEKLDVHGAEHIQSAFDSGKGAVLLGSHTGQFLAQLAVAGSLGREVWAFGNPLPSRRAEASLMGFFRLIGIDRKLVRQGQSSGAKDLLSRKGLVIAFCDLTSVPRNNAWVPFGQIDTLVNLGPALLGLRNEAPLFVLTSRWLADGRVGVWIHPLPPVTRTGDLLRDAYGAACQAMAIISSEVQSHPEQWWHWDLARYRTKGGRVFGWLAPFEIHELAELRASH